ncbi:MAG: hypothetical protein JXQ90_23425 [Cyclobacteriaceae bacterium]
MKKVLVISYYWPPSGGVSVLRSLKIVKYLGQFGWEPIVYVPANAHYPYLDEYNSKDVPEGLNVISKKIIEPFEIFKILTGRKKSDALNSIVQIEDKRFSFVDRLGIYVRGNFFIPDARSLWIKPSVKFLESYVKENPVDAIFTDGPPHTNTRIGCLLKQKTGIPWLSDFQDPWTQVDYYDLFPIRKRADKIHKKQEQEVFQFANKITIASPSWKTDLECIGANNVDVVYYGYDEDDFANRVKKGKQNQFIIVHTGLLGHDRHPSGLIEACNSMPFAEDITLRLIGQVDQSVLKAMQDISNIKIEVIGHVSRSEAIQHALDANVLLLPLNCSKNVKGRLPGKLYEYLRSYTPILGLGPKDSDASKILSRTKAGVCLEYGDKTGISKYLESVKKEFLPTIDKTKIDEFSNYNQTKKIAKYLNEIT